jgi:tetratricopeptide (TPR) repeat protein
MARLHDRLIQRTDTDATISLMRRILELTPDHDPFKQKHLIYFGLTLMNRFEYFGRLDDANEAIACFMRVFDIIPDEYRHKSFLYTGLGAALASRFELLDDHMDMEDSIAIHSLAVEAMDDDDENTPGCLHHLSNALWIRFQRLGIIQDIDNVVSVSRRAVELAPHGHASMPAYMITLGASLSLRFDRLGDADDINISISVLRLAAGLTPDTHKNKPACLANLGSSLHNRFTRFGDIVDLENSIAACRRAVELSPDHYSDKPKYLSGLVNRLLTRFQCLGELEDIEHAIIIMRLTVELSSEGHPNHSKYLDTLSLCLSSRFERLKQAEDAKEMVAVARRSVELVPDGHSDRARPLNNLGTALIVRFKHIGERSDVEDSIVILRLAIDICPEDHPDRVLILTNLVSAQQLAQSVASGESYDRIITEIRLSVDLIPNGHIKKPMCLTNLAIALRRRFQDRYLATGPPSEPREHSTSLPTSLPFPTIPSTSATPSYHPYMQDIEEAIVISERAIELIPVGHPERVRALQTLADSLDCHARFAPEPWPVENLWPIVTALMAAADAIGAPSARLSAARQGASLLQGIVSALARAVSDQVPDQAWSQSLLRIHSRIIELIPRVIWSGFNVDRRYSDLVKLGGAVNSAAAAAIVVGDITLALEWLESGRNIVWRQFLRLRTPLDELEQQHPDLARELCQVIAMLDSSQRGSAVLQPSMIIDEPIRHLPSAQDEAQNHRLLTLKYEKLVRTIRELNSFQSFLQPKQLQEIAPAAKNGSVVLINVAETRCDALVLCPDVTILHVPLGPIVSYALLRTISARFTQALIGEKLRERHATRGLSVEKASSIMVRVLRWLWIYLVQPILQAIEELVRFNQGLPDSRADMAWLALGARHRRHSTCYLVRDRSCSLPSSPCCRTLRSERRELDQGFRLCRLFLYAHARRAP